MRMRVYALFSELGLENYQRNIHNIILSKMGIEIPDVGASYVSYDYKRFFCECELIDFLDILTVIFKHLEETRVTSISEMWANRIQQIFSEENVSYTTDDLCGIHLAVDNEFEHNKSSTIRSLRSSRYSGVLAAFEKAHTALDQVPPDGKLAIHQAFEAVEILFRLMFPSAPRLAASDATTRLTPLVQSQLAADATALRSTQKILNSFCDWVEGAHFYRHGQGEEEPVQPPLSLAILMVSTAASYLRWLAEIDETARGAQAVVTS
ncbi:MAG: hypothetical protein IT565_10960 [Rhodospirillales bacterium]|nr:hypothetical protein [Rhodospirillales bacterium]